MAAASRREEFLLTFETTRVDIRYDSLLRKTVYKMFLTNLRNRPLSSADIQSMTKTIPSLYHNLVTGSSSFPVIPCRAFVTSVALVSPFPAVVQSVKENSRPSPLTEGPARMMVPPAGAAVKTILTPVLPDKADLRLLRADRRNSVRTMALDGCTVTRVISPVYLSEDSMLENRWRVTDYSTDGKVLMSVLCWFQHPPRTKKRKGPETSRPPAKRIRV